MKKYRFSEAQIFGILRQQGQGQTAVQICREHGISEPTFYHCKSKYGGLELTELQRLKQLQEENRRLKQLVADLSPDNQVVKEVLRKKWWPRPGPPACPASDRCRGGGGAAGDG